MRITDAAIVVVSAMLWAGIAFADEPVPAPTTPPTTQPASEPTTAPATQPCCVTVSSDGVSIACAGWRPLLVQYPKFKDFAITQIEVDPAGNSSRLTYGEAIRLTVKVKSDAIEYAFRDLPVTIKSVPLWMDFDPSFADGGCYRLNDGDAVDFPATQPADPQFVKQHNARRFALHDRDERNLVFSLSNADTYLQVADHRDQSSPKYSMVMAIPTNPGNPVYTVYLGEIPSVVPAVVEAMMTVERTRTPIVADANPDEWEHVPGNAVNITRIVEGKPASPNSATIRCAWDENNLYLLVTAVDPTPMKNPNRPEELWMGDAVELFIGPDHIDCDGDCTRTDRQVLIGIDAADTKSLVKNAADATVAIQAQAKPIEGGWTLEAAIPFKSLGIAPDPGVAFRFDIAVDDSAIGESRLLQLVWAGTNRNSLSRTGWGHAVLK